MGERDMPEYSIIEKEAPASARSKSTLYSEIVADFLEKHITSVLVQLSNRKPATVYIGLKKAVKEANAPLKVRKLGDEVYIVKK